MCSQPIMPKARTAAKRSTPRKGGVALSSKRFDLVRSPADECGAVVIVPPSDRVGAWNHARSAWPDNEQPRRKLATPQRDGVPPRHCRIPATPPSRKPPAATALAVPEQREHGEHAAV